MEASDIAALGGVIVAGLAVIVTGVIAPRIGARIARDARFWDERARVYVHALRAFDAAENLLAQKVGHEDAIVPDDLDEEQWDVGYRLHLFGSPVVVKEYMTALALLRDGMALADGSPEQAQQYREVRKQRLKLQVAMRADLRDRRKRWWRFWEPVDPMVAMNADGLADRQPG